MDNVIDLRSISRDDGIISVTLRGLPDEPGAAYRVFGLLADKNIDVDIILQSISEAHRNDIVFTVGAPDKNRVESVLRQELDAIGAKDVIIDANVTKVSVSAVGMKGTPGIAARVFRALYEADIEIAHISTSEIKISLIMKTEYADEAMNALYNAFGLSV